jgi:exodeoxyribonuclease VII small subunit
MSDTNKLGVAGKIAQLDELVAWFDSDEFELERAIEKFKAAETLAADIEKDLKELKNSIEVVKARFDKASE